MISHVRTPLSCNEALDLNGKTLATAHHCKSARKQKKKRAVRQNSNVFAMFDQKQIAEFKEAFSLIDHDNDGFLDKEDLKDMLASLGIFVLFLIIFRHSLFEIF